MVKVAHREVADAAPGEPVRVSGVARAVAGDADDDAPLLACSRVAIGEAEHAADQGGPFVVETADGRRVAVSPPARLEGRLVPHVERRGPWWEVPVPLRDHFDEVAPSPGVHVRVTAATLRDGDRVTVLGRALEVGPVGGAGPAYRTAPARHVVRIAADVVGVGPDAAEAARHAERRLAGARTAEDPHPWEYLWTWGLRFLTAAPLALVALATGGRLDHAPRVAVAALAAWAVGAAATRGQPLRPSATAEVGPGRSTAMVWALALLGAAVLLLWSRGRPDAVQLGAPAVVVLLAIGPEVVLVAQAARAWQAAHRFAARLRPGPGRAVIEATAPAGLSTRAATGAEVAIGDAVRRIDLVGAWLATEEVDDDPGLVRTGPGFHRVAPGGRVLIAGPIDPAGDLAAAEPGAIALFGCGRGAPRAVLAGKVRGAAFATIELTLVLAASVAIALAQLAR